MLHLDAHGARTNRLFERELIRIIGRTVMEATDIIKSRELVDSNATVFEGGGFGKDAWFINAFVITIRSERCQIGCSKIFGKSIAWKADDKGKAELVGENHGRLMGSERSSLLER